LRQAAEPVTVLVANRSTAKSYNSRVWTPARRSSQPAVAPIHSWRGCELRGQAAVW